MSILIVGLILFFGMHLVPTLGGVRENLVGRLGENQYKGLFSLLSFIGLILIVFGKARAGFEPLWNPPAWGAKAALVLMAPVFILVMAANMESNVRRFLRYPMLLGITLWALAHLLANGDLASLLLFGSFGVYSLFDMWSASRRGAELMQDKAVWFHDVIVLVVGVLAYLLLLEFHFELFGVPAVY